MPAPPPTEPRLRAVTIAVDDIGPAAALIATVCGSPVIERADHALVQIDDTTIVVEPLRGPGRPGLVGVEIAAATGQRHTTRLNGIDVTVAPAGSAAPGSTIADVVVDHVAVVVTDLEGAARQWESTIDVSAELIGVHPASNGTMAAARFTVGDRMLELVSPIAGTNSAIAARLAQVGEGPLALALPAKDLEAKRRQLTDDGVKLSWQEPHWLVHPANPAGVLIQLTPRVHH